MRLVRLVVATFTPAPDPLPGWNATVRGVDISTMGTGPAGGAKRLLVRGSLQLAGIPGVSAAGEIEVPASERIRIEQALEEAIELVAVSLGAARTISSPTPCIALVPETDEEKTLLSIAVSFLPNRVLHEASSGTAKFDLNATTIGGLADRTEGVKLMAEALAQSHPTGRLHELVRLFEAGFRESSKNLVKPLAEFLGSTFLQFTMDEVENWILRVRNQTIHGDRKHQPRLAYEADVRPILGRVELAAYDVLFNKVGWHDPSVTRRDLWTPHSGPVSASGADIFLGGGGDTTLSFSLVDQFGTFRVDLNAVLTSAPDGWWVGRAPEAAFSGSIRVLAEGVSLARAAVSP